MNDPTPQPCPHCGEGSYYNFHDRSFNTHYRRYCKAVATIAKSAPETQESSAVIDDGDSRRHGLLYATRTLLSVNQEIADKSLDPGWKSTFQYGYEFEYDHCSENNDILSSSALDPDREPPPIPIPPAESTLNVPPSESFCFQLELNDILQRHRAHLSMHDEIVGLLKSYVGNGRVSAEDLDLKSRETFLRDVKSRVGGNGMAPRHETVTLHDGSLATVSVFDLEKMIISLLTDESLFCADNLAKGVNVHTGAVDPSDEVNLSYGEVHTGDAWKPAVTHFCGDDGRYMPISLIVFGDKSHTDLHGSLSVTPVIFTLSIFNRKARNLPQFWRPIAYIPNLTHGHGKASKIDADDKAKDLHSCLNIAFRQFISIHERGGIRFRLAGKERVGRVWIHFFIGDIEGNNAWTAHFNNSKKGVSRPYRDCLCCHGGMSRPNPQCVYITPSEITQAKQNKIRSTRQVSKYTKLLKSNREKAKAIRKGKKNGHRLSGVKRKSSESVQQLDQAAAQLKVNIKKHKQESVRAFKSISKRDIPLIFNHPQFPISDQEHGVYGTMPPELLHTSGAGLIMRMFEVIRTVYKCKSGKSIRNKIDMLHRRMNAIIRRNSERDFPRGSDRNGLVDGTKCQSHERRGNLLRLLLISYTKSGANCLETFLEKTSSTITDFRHFIKIYLSMEEWFHDENPKEEVRCSRALIADVLRRLKRVFPRENGQKWCLPKFHGMTKMQTYMLKYGSGMNFFGGPGESHHKFFVKFPGQNTQRRVNEFSKQISNRVHENMLMEMAQSKVRTQFEFIGNSSSGSKPGLVVTDDEGDKYILTGKYTIKVEKFNPALTPPGTDATVNVCWSSNNKAKSQLGCFGPAQPLLNTIFSEASKAKVSGEFKVVCYTEMKTECEGIDVNFRACPHYQGRSWYDWAMINFNELVGKKNEQVEQNQSYPSELHGFLKFPWSPRYYAAVTTSTTTIPWDRLSRQFVSKFTIGRSRDECNCTVPITSVARPLLVIPDIGGDGQTFFCVLPRRHWSRFFGDKIDISLPALGTDDHDSSDSDVPEEKGSVKSSDSSSELDESDVDNASTSDIEDSTSDDSEESSSEESQ